LCREGEKAERLFILEEGAVAIRMQGGEAVTIDTPGKTVGCSFLVPPNRYTASAVTLTPAKMLTIQRPDFSYLIHKSPRLGIKVMANLAQVVAGRLGQFKGRP
jgi:CRP-like cAMP-binding protein